MAETVAETARVRLRTWDEADINAFMAHLNTPAVMRWLGGVQTRADYEAAYQRISACQAEHGHSFWIVERKADDALLGFCGLKRFNSQGSDLTGSFEIGWRLREDAWGQGYAREAASASLDYAFDTLNAPFVVALTVQGNTGSWGLMERLGMERRADLDFVDPRFGSELNPTIIYRIGREQWKA